MVSILPKMCFPELGNKCKNIKKWKKKHWTWYFSPVPGGPAGTMFINSGMWGHTFHIICQTTWYLLHHWIVSKEDWTSTGETVVTPLIRASLYWETSEQPTGYIGLTRRLKKKVKEKVKSPMSNFKAIGQRLGGYGSRVSNIWWPLTLIVALTTVLPCYRATHTCRALPQRRGKKPEECR